MSYREIVEQLMLDPIYRRNIEFGEPRPGHPEGKIRNHIYDLEQNLEKIKHRLDNQENYWKLKFLIHIHDTFKADAAFGVKATDARSHASLARNFAEKFTHDHDILNIIQFHDENYSLWKQYKRSGAYDTQQLQSVFDNVHDLDLYLVFTIIDGYTRGKELEKLPWFINEVKQYKKTKVDATWTNLT